MKPAIYLTSAGFVLAVSIIIHQIRVGPGLTFDPESITASRGDVLEFHFYAKNHSVATGDYYNACHFPKVGGFFSGYVPTSVGSEGSQRFRVIVNDTNPLWYYCTQGSHCRDEMVGVVNPPAVPIDGTLDAYKNKSATFAGKADDAPIAFGGQLILVGTNSTDATSPPSSITTPTNNDALPSSPPNQGAGSEALGGLMLCTLGTMLWGLI